MTKRRTIPLDCKSVQNRAELQFCALGRGYKIVIWILVLLWSLGFGVCSLPAAPRPTASLLEGLPLYFEPNCGQADASTWFVARNLQAVFCLGPTETVMTLRVPSAVTFGSSAGCQSAVSPIINRQGHGTDEGDYRVLQLRFLGANPAACMVGSDELPGRINYLLGNDPAKWQTNLPTFRRIHVPEIYPGIDLVQYGNERQLEYDFQVSPGADPRVIAFQVTGADSLQIDPNGDLILKLGTSKVRQKKPFIYQLEGSVRKEITGAYALKDKETVVLDIGDYDRRAPLIIDPVLSYSTFLGGLGADVGRGIALDNAGNIFITGDTVSGQLGTPGAFQPLFAIGYPAASGDAFIAKFDPTGTNLLFFTYLGGSGDDAATSIALDTEGNPYVTGVTDSTNFPIPSLTISNKISGQGELYFGLHPFDAFVAKLSSDGSQLIYATYLGGRGTDEGLGIAVDQNFNAYVTGFTQSKDFPTTPDAFQTNLHGTSAAFVTKIASNGTSFVYSTFIGGTNAAQGQSIALDVLGRAYITGSTTSTNFPLSPDAFQTNQPLTGLPSQAFVTVLESNGMDIVASTLLGGLGNAFGFRVALDTAGAVYVTGSENGTGFPVTPGNINPGGIFKSSDAATNWAPSNVGLLHKQVRAIAIDPLNTANLYAGTGRGIASSTNAGATWQVSLDSFDQVATFAINPTNPSTIYAGATHVLKSTNSGASWFPSTNGLGKAVIAPTNTFVTITKLVIDPTVTETLYAGTLNGVYKSTDAAAHWHGSSQGLGSLTINDLVIDPSAPAVLYAATSAGVFRSTNSGGLWRAFNQGLTNLFATALTLDSSPNPTAYVGLSDGSIFKRPPTATNWFLLTTGLMVTNSVFTNIISFNSVTLLAADPTTPATIYAGTRDGVFKSLDAGTNWTILTNGLPNLPIAALAIDPVSPSVLYSGMFNSFAGIDAFVTKLTSDLSAVVYSVLLGGSGIDQGLGLAVDSSGDAFVVGATTSPDFPIANPVDYPSSFNSGLNDAFIAAINPDGSDFLFSTYLGGSGNDLGLDIALDPAGNIWVIGQTSSPDFPIAGGINCCLQGPSDVFLAKLSATSNSLVDVTLQTSPPGVPLFVDGSTNDTPVTFHWPEFSFHTIAGLPQSAGTNAQYTWTGWSDGGALVHNIPAVAPTNITASFKLQYLLTMLTTNLTVTDTNLSINATNSGLTAPATGFYDAGTNLAITAIPPRGNSFAGWAGTGVGAFSGTNNPAGITLNGPITETAMFTGPLTNRVTVIINGTGSVSPNYNGSALKVGNFYTTSATPGKGAVFASWLFDNTTISVPRLTFQMTNGLVLEANFVPSPFTNVAGTYAGLFYNTNVAAFESSGFFSATVTAPGRISGRLQIGAPSYSFSGQFPASGELSVVVPRAGLPSLLVNLQLDFTGTNNFLLTGQIDSGSGIGQLTANRAVFSSTNSPPQAGNKYTVVFPGASDSLSQPAGDGYGTVNIDKSGNISFSGKLGDGTTLAQKTFISGQGQWPFYVALYGGNGAIFGWLTFADLPDTDISGLIHWFKLPRPFTSLYPSGFSLQSDAQGSLYTFTNGIPILALNNGQGQLVLENGKLTQSTVYNFTLSPANKVTSTNKMTLTFNTASGLFQGSAMDAGTNRTVSFSGAVVQKQNRGGGVFRQFDQTGSARIEPH